VSLLVVGSVAFDALESPYGKVDRALGGAATYFAVAASFFTHVNLVGIVGDVKPNPFDHDPAPTVYVPLAQQPELISAFVVRTQGDPVALVTSLDAQMRNVDPDQPAYDVRTLNQVVSDNLSGVEQSAQMMLVFGFSALALAAAAGADHLFAVKYRLFAAGRWPLGIVGDRCFVF